MFLRPVVSELNAHIKNALYGTDAHSQGGRGPKKLSDVLWLMWNKSLQTFLTQYASLDTVNEFEC